MFVCFRSMSSLVLMFLITGSVLVSSDPVTTAIALRGEEPESGGGFIALIIALMVTLLAVLGIARSYHADDGMQMEEEAHDPQPGHAFHMVLRSGCPHCNPPR